MSNHNFCLKWEDHHSKITSVFECLRMDDELVDTTLSCPTDNFRVHRLVLCACSPYFRQMLKFNQHQHMVFFIKDTSAADLRALVEFMYKGSVNVCQSQLASFIKTAEALQIRGLSGDDDNKNTAAASNSGSLSTSAALQLNDVINQLSSPPTPPVQLNHPAVKRRREMSHSEDADRASSSQVTSKTSDSSAASSNCRQLSSVVRTSSEQPDRTRSSSNASESGCRRDKDGDMSSEHSAHQDASNAAVKVEMVELSSQLDSILDHGGECLQTNGNAGVISIDDNETSTSTSDYNSLRDHWNQATAEFNSSSWVAQSSRELSSHQQQLKRALSASAIKWWPTTEEEDSTSSPRAPRRIYKCKKCGLAANQETGHRRYSGHVYCPTCPEDGLNYIDWLNRLRAKLARQGRFPTVIESIAGSDVGMSLPATPTGQPSSGNTAAVAAAVAALMSRRLSSASSSSPFQTHSASSHLTGDCATTLSSKSSLILPTSRDD